MKYLVIVCMVILVGCAKIKDASKVTWDIRDVSEIKVYTQQDKLLYNFKGHCDTYDNGNGSNIVECQENENSKVQIWRFTNMLISESPLKNEVPLTIIEY